MNSFLYHLMLLAELFTFRISGQEYTFRSRYHIDPKSPASNFWEVVVDDPEQSAMYDSAKKGTIKVKIVATRGIGGGATRLITDNREQAMNLKAVIEHDAKQLRTHEFYYKWVVNSPSDPMLWDSIKMRSEKDEVRSDTRYAKKPEEEESTSEM